MSTMTTSSSPQSSPQSAMSVFWENVRIIIYSLALAMAVRFTIAQPFRIPSGSMQPTLEAGDYVLVTKWSLGYGRFSFAPLEGLLPEGRIFARAPERGEVVVFRPASEPDRDFIKRVIGLPGDRIQMIDGQLFLNGEAVTRELVGEVDFSAYENPPRYPGPMLEYRETLPNGVSYTTFDRTPNGDLDQTRLYIVPDGHYFMMGDDRDFSDDSRRSVGYVPFDHIVGPAQFVVASFDTDTSLLRPWTLFTGFRGDRFMKAVE